MTQTTQLFRPEQLKLSNGIPVILQDYDGPVAATYWWVKTGSADEGRGEEGFAHFLEHMLFKDAAAKETGRASTGQMAHAIESLGGDVNAYTSFDQTVYHVTCAGQHWEKVLDAWGTIARPQRFLKADFEREREVILEELRKNEDSPGKQLFETMFGLTFRRHPYGRPVIGYEKTLRAARVEKLESFYRRMYSPERMGLVVVGPLGQGERRKGILRRLERHFGSAVWPVRRGKTPAPALKSTRPHEPERRPSPAMKARGFDVQTPTFSISFRVPELEHEDIPALDLLSSALATGELSRLYQKLFYESSLATDTSGGLYVPRDPGMMYFTAEVDAAAKIQPAARKMFEELRRIRDEGPTQEEISRVLVNTESERLYATQSADGMAGRLGFLGFVLGNLSYDEHYLGELRRVDAGRVREAAREYLSPARMSCAVLLPKGEAKGYDLAPLAQMAEEILGAPKPRPAPRAREMAPGERLPEMIELPSGLRVLHLERPQSSVFSAYAATFGGTRLELTRPVDSSEKDWGSSYMMSLTWSKGTETRDSREIARIVEGSASSLDGFSGRNTVGLQMTGLARDWEKLSQLFSEVLVAPSFSETEVEHSRRVAEDAVRGIDDHSSQVCSKLFLQTLFETHPYGRLTTGSLESLAAIDSAKLREFHRRWLRPERLVLAVSGRIGADAVRAWATELGRRLGERIAAAGASELLSLDDEAPLRAPRWVEKSLGREQVHILVGSLGTTVHSEDRHALHLLQTLLGGQSGRLFVELREKKSLAYTVAPVSFEGLERGYIGTYIACAPGKREEATQGIRTVLEKLAARGPTTSEMKRAKQYLLGRRAMDMQGDSSLAAHFGMEKLYGIPSLTEGQLASVVRRVSAREIQRACRKYLVEPAMVTSAVG